MNKRKKQFPRVLLPDKPAATNTARETAISRAAKEVSKLEDHLLLRPVYHKGSKVASAFRKILRIFVEYSEIFALSRPKRGAEQ